jgi:hypothetical protein
MYSRGDRRPHFCAAGAKAAAHEEGSMRVLTSLVCVLTLAGAALSMSAASARVLPHRIVLRGGGWTLTLIDDQMPYGQTAHGSITHLGHTYVMQGDVIPTVDEPQWLLRFYGSAFPGTSLKTVGLISVAVLVSACPPTCPHGCIGTPCPTYHGDWYLLKALSERTAGGWTLPGDPHAHHVRLRMRQVHP